MVCRDNVAVVLGNEVFFSQWIKQATVKISPIFEIHPFFTEWRNHFQKEAGSSSRFSGGILLVFRGVQQEISRSMGFARFDDGKCLEVTLLMAWGPKFFPRDILERCEACDTKRRLMKDRIEAIGYGGYNPHVKSWCAITSMVHSSMTTKISIDQLTATTNQKIVCRDVCIYIYMYMCVYMPSVVLCKSYPKKNNKPSI